jgi:TolC family type I secretion outer membrane protein
MPNVSLSMSRNRNDLDRTAANALGNPVTTNTRYNSSGDSLTVRQPIIRLFQFADLDKAQAQVDDANAVLERELQNVAVRVSGAYFEALLAQEQLSMVSVQKNTATTQLDAARKRLKGGLGTRTDVDEAMAAVDLRTAQELEASQNLDLTTRQLENLINRPVDFLAALDPAKLELLVPQPNNLDDWIARAEQDSPEIQSLKAQVQAAHYEISKARSGHLPTLDVVAQWTRQDSDTVSSVNNKYTNKSVGVQLNVPLFAGGAVNSQVRQAVAEKERAEQALEALRRDLAVRLHREFRGVTEGVLRIRALEQSVKSMQQVVRANQLAFEGGSRTLLDTLNAQQQQATAQRDLAQARFVYLLSRVRLLSLAGGPKAEVITQVNQWLMPPS